MLRADAPDSGPHPHLRPAIPACWGRNLREAYALVAKHAPGLTLGGITIAERHERSQDEHERILSKSAAGCRFFVTQAVYDVTSTLSLISDYTLALRETGDRPLPIVLTFSPCGSLKTLAFMNLPRGLQLGARQRRATRRERRERIDPQSRDRRLDLPGPDTARSPGSGSAPVG
ncbi:MAG: hypothetical protein ABI895_38050 [Deltaproteobacteria bacterium]